MTETLHSLLARAAQLAPDHPAVVDGERMLSYRQLNSRSNQLAHRLVEMGVRPGARVAIKMEKSVETLVAVYGVLKSGAAYVPLPVHQPSQREAHILATAGIEIMVTAGEASRPPGVRQVDLMDLGRSETMQSVAPTVQVVSDDHAYVLFTSGSSGRPKGVALSHRNALSFVAWGVAEFGISQADRIANHAPLHFDLSVFDLFAAARAAATVVLVPRSAQTFPRELGAFIEQHHISVWYSVPSALQLMVRRGGVVEGELASLRLILFAGEVFPIHQLRALMELAPQAEYANLYGPTETNVCTFYRVPNPLPDSCSALPIGIPIDEVEVTAHSDDGTPVPDGVQGELWVRGPTVMQCYLADPELTRAAIQPIPPNGYPAYRTGDLGHRDADGVWWFSGRRDAQIKSRGYRIELGEIEAALYSHPAVTECAAVAVPHEQFGNRIVAYVAVRSGCTRADLVAHSRAFLPSYMVPWSLEVRESLPRTSTGKIDYQRL
ncbi:amino acid adenylation domain-containing protein [Streptomyces sp. NPDC056661]|uniref:amino acid adenylation domain-containing protein n=1 Tax=Streptomyces sp. NPDC056661 TaxID=3345898 RepID=UPI003697CDD8